MKNISTSTKAVFTALIFCILSVAGNGQTGPKWATQGNAINNGDFIGTTNAYGLTFATNNTANMWLTVAGNLGLGTSTPHYKLDVAGRSHYTGNILADSSITAIHLNAIQKVSCDALQVYNNAQIGGIAVIGNKVTLDGANSSITSSAGEISFGNNNLNTTGSISIGSIFASGDCRFNSLAGSGRKLLQADSLGNIIPFSFSGNADNVLLGNGAWGTFPQKSPWLADSNGIYPDTTLVNKNVFVKNLYASNSVNIGTFRFKNGVLPGERDTISAERPVVIKAAERIEFSADTLTMKDRVGIGVDRPQYALDVAGDVNTSGTVYANNLYAQNSIAIGTLKISNGAPGSGKDSIASPYKLALVSAGREISLISDTVKIGDYSSTVRFDVNGSIRVRDLLWVENGIIVGRKFEGDTVSSERSITKNVEAESVTADTVSSAMSRADTAFTQKLLVAGDARIDGNLSIYGNLTMKNIIDSIPSFTGKTIKISRILSNDSIIHFGDSSVALNLHYNSISWSSMLPCGGCQLVKGLSIGNDYQTHPWVFPIGWGLNSIAMGAGPTNTRAMGSIAIGTNIMSDDNAFNSVTIGAGIVTPHYDYSFGLINDKANSLMVGFQSNIPTFYVGPAHGVGTTGNVGIGTKDPKTLLQVSEGENKVTLAGLGNDWGDLGWSTSYIGFNAYREYIGSHWQWVFKTNENHNGGGVIMNNIAGPMVFIPVNFSSDVSIDQSISESGEVFYKKRVMVIEPLGSNGWGIVKVCGLVKAKEFEATTANWWADFVFDKDYNLLSIPDLEDYIRINKHLPDVPSTNDVKENGYKLIDMDAILLKKIEELTLYMIELKKENNVLKEKVNKLEDIQSMK